MFNLIVSLLVHPQSSDPHRLPSLACSLVLLQETIDAILSLMHRPHHNGLYNSQGQKRKRYLLLINDNSNVNFSDCKYLLELFLGDDALKKNNQDLSVHFIKGITQIYKGLNPCGLPSDKANSLGIVP